MPIRAASAPDSLSPVRITAIAAWRRTLHVRRQVLAPAGIVPKSRWLAPMTAALRMRTMSAACMSSKPAPIASPSTAARTGISMPAMASQARRKAAKIQRTMFYRLPDNDDVDLGIAAGLEDGVFQFATRDEGDRVEFPGCVDSDPANTCFDSALNKCHVTPDNDEFEREHSGRPPVVVGVDGSPASELATAIAFDETSWRGVDVVALHASCDTVVVGSHGRGEFVGMLLGSVSTALAQAARVPVTVARHSGRGRPRSA